ncbi:hypothetical protein [Actinomadura sp. WAC 06369]|uniref:hypothetical protein n=1 Tax=Actinomadura sp. WAC 06369 TaxID=2203193 RepID=UPI000F794B7D|nr:hypothetical protein [Actinomadura sp. WAC 06369]
MVTKFRAMARRRAAFTVATVAAAVVAAQGVGPGTAAGREIRSAESATRVNCVVPGLSVVYTVCSNPFLVAPGQEVHIRLVASGGKPVAFCLEPAGGGWDHGCVKYAMRPGESARVWHNRTGATRNVQLIANTNERVDVRVQGDLTVR